MTDPRPRLPVPLPQSEPYLRACESLGVTVRRELLGDPADPDLVCHRLSRRMPVLGRVDLVSRGPVAQDAAHVENWLRRAGDGGGVRRPAARAPLLLNASGPAPEALRDAGFWPLVTPATLALCPLGPSPAMRAVLGQKWRNRLARAESSDLRVSRRPLGRGHWLLEAEARQARQRRYRTLPPFFVRALSDASPGAVWIWEACHRAEPVAALCVIRHGAMATWQTGLSLPEGRRLNAMNLLLWEAMRWLAAQGHEVLDLGVVNTDDAPGVARFKRGTGARVERLGGTWLHWGTLAPAARRLPLRLAG